MSESTAEVCLVRCPKCENLLPEVTGYSVYQCGGCGAVLRARNKMTESVVLLDEEHRGFPSKTSKELGNVDFVQETTNLSSGVDQEDLKSKGSMQIDQDTGDLEISQDSEDSEPRKNYSRRSVRSSVGASADDRIELLRKLDEIKDQIVRSCPLGDKSKEKAPVFNNPIRPQILRRAPFDHDPQNPCFPGQYASNGFGNPMQFHHPLCSCLVCYSNQHHRRPPPPPPVYYRHYYDDPRFATLPKPYTRWSNNLQRPRRGILTSGGRRCRLVAGGTPFMACCSCFELLQIPEKGLMSKKVRCAVCSEVILLSVVNKKLVRNSEKGLYNNKNKRRNAKWNFIEFSSQDFDVSGGFEFGSLDRLRLRSQSLTSEDERGLGSVKDPKSCNISTESNKPSSPPSRLPLQDHFDSSENDYELQSSMEDVAVATEIEISSNEYCVNTNTSQESLDQRGGHESFLVGMIKKSFKLSRSNQHVDHGKVNGSISISVNGHQLTERLVKKAEKLSGPIQPGDYWYDSRAGFWGMMGGPCRGIIPPLIEEFNYPMPENCANGDTGVFVNGRQLHEKDLDLLASRGLPTDSDRSYIIEISGKVLDEDSGNELQCLGKLAPTVESQKHGFGMKPPKMIA